MKQFSMGARPNEFQRDGVHGGPLIEMLARELGPVVAHERPRQGRERIQKLGDPLGADRVPHQEARRLPRTVVDEREDAHPAPIA